MNTALVQWFLKQQATIETSVFGAEIEGTTLQVMHDMMGVGISGPSYIYGNNMSVIHNTQRPESMLKKKSGSICYHTILTNSAHDTGVVSEGEREIAHRNWWCKFCPATAWIKPSERHIRRPKTFHLQS